MGGGGWVGGWLEQLGIRLSQLPTKLKLKLKLKLSLAKLFLYQSISPVNLLRINSSSNHAFYQCEQLGKVYG